MDLSRIPFVRSPHFTVGTSDRRAYDYVVIHDMEYPERNDAAENVARYFATTDREVSAHFCVDADSVVQCVKLSDVAWAAPGCNSNGIQIELAGYARQSAVEWNDPYSSAMLELAAELTFALCKKYAIPVAFIPAEGIKVKRRGITTHAQVTRAFPDRGDGHSDPGPAFPLSDFIGRVDRFGGERPHPGSKPWPVPVPAWFWPWATWKLNAMAGPRPAGADAVIAREGRIPPWAWVRLSDIIERRKVR